MDGQKSCALLLLLMTTLAGCDQKRLLPIWPRSTDPHANRKPIDLPPAAVNEKPKELMPETLVAMGQFREQQAVELDLTDQGREYYRDQARKAYERALKIDPKSIPARLALARLYEKLGNHQKAVECYQQALKLDAKNANLYYEVGMAHAQHKEWDPALDHMRQAVELDPDNRLYTRSYGLALARAGKVPESLLQLRKVLKEAEAHFMVARMMRHLKQEDACKQHLDLALQIDPSLEPAKELLAELRGEKAPIVKAAAGTSDPLEEETEEKPPAKEPKPEPTAAADRDELEEE